MSYLKKKMKNGRKISLESRHCILATLTQTLNQSKSKILNKIHSVVIFYFHDNARNKITKL